MGLYRMLSDFINRREERLPPTYREFQPSAQMVEETPASPALRITSLTICTFFFLAILWAIFGEINIVATGRGRLVPAQDVKVIQTLENGEVRDVLVSDGENVKKGQKLIVLDPTYTGSDLKALKYQRETQSERYMVYKALLGADLVNCNRPSLSMGDKRRFNSTQQEIYNALLDEAITSCRRINQQISAQEARVSATQRDILRQEESLPLVQDRYDRVKTLSDQDLMSKITELRVEQELVDARNKLDQAKDVLLSEERSLNELRERQGQAAASFRRDITERLGEARDKMYGLNQEINKQEKRYQSTVIRSPIDGRVQQLSVTSKSGVVRAGDHLMSVVPEDSQLVAEVFIPNKDIGFVNVGQSAEVKIDSFKYTLYGLLEGQIISLSRGAILTEPNSALPPSNQIDQQASYSAKVSINQQWMNIEGKKVYLTPGMAVTAEISTGKQRVIEFLLSPILKYKHEALRER